MSFKLYYHPLSSFCQKALIALYENDLPFDGEITDVASDAGRAAFAKIWPLCRFPVLRDAARGQTIPESSIIIEYLQQHAPGQIKLIPSNPERALEVRRWDRFFDLDINTPMGKVMTDRLRPAGQNDSYGVAQAKAQIATAYQVLDAALAGKTWAAGDDFTMADCAAAPALFYGNMIVPFGDHRKIAAYYQRLAARPSCTRVVSEAEPYLKLMPR